jgi:hypothetical protein
MKLVRMSSSDAAAVDADLVALQIASAEPDLVKAIATAWAPAVAAVVEPLLPNGAELVVGASFIHGTPKVRPMPSLPRDPELGDLVVITAYTAGGLLNRGRAVIFQAKTPRTVLPPHQATLYRSWPAFTIISPAIPGATWDVRPEGSTVPPSRRGTALLRVANGDAPTRYEIDRSSQTKSLGECIRSMLRLRYSRAFALSAPDLSGTNTWDQLITFLLHRTEDPILAKWFGRFAPTGRGFTPRPGSGAEVASRRTAPPGSVDLTTDVAGNEPTMSVVYAVIDSASVEGHAPLGLEESPSL